MKNKKPESLKKVFVIATQHLDVAWLWNRVPHGEDLMMEVLARSVELAEENPEAKFIMSRSTAWGFSIVEKKYPRLFAKVQKAVANGSIELSGGQWVEPDNAAPSGEAFIRQSLYGQTYYFTRFGKTAKVAWNPDVFMHGNTLPQIFLKSGLEGYYFHRCRPVDQDGNTLFQFIWEGPDGSKVYCYTGNWILKPDEGALDSIFESTRLQSLPVDYMVTGRTSDRRITVESDWMDLPKALKEKHDLEECKWAGSDGILEEMKGYTEELPVISGDLGGYSFTGTYTSDQRTKRYNRRLENELSACEFINSWNLLNGGVYYHSLLTEGWKDLCINQFHDVLCGTCYRSAQEEAYALYRDVERRNSLALAGAQEELSRTIKTNAQSGVPYVIHNPVSLSRNDAVTIALSDRTPVEFVSATGEKIPSQIIERKNQTLAVLLPETPVPGCGFQVYYGRKSGGYAVDFDDSLVLENEFVRVELDSVYGSFTSFFDKKLKTEFVKKGEKANRIVYYEDRNDYAHSTDHNWDPWFIKTTGQKYDPHGAYRVYVLESGPVCKTIRVERSLSITSNYPNTVINQDISLYKNSPMVHVRMSGDFQGERVLVKSEFPFSFDAPTVACDMPYGMIERTSDYAAETEVGSEAAEDRVKQGDKRDESDRPMHMWLDFSDGEKGMAIFNNGKYGYSSTSSSIGLSLMRAPVIREHEVAGLGDFEFSYAFFPHAGTWRDADIPAMGYLFNREIMVSQTWSHGGNLNSDTSLFSVSDPAVLITSIKRAELSGDIIIRLYESKGVPAEIKLSSAYPLKKVCEVNAVELEVIKDNLTVDKDHEIPLTMGRFEIKTLKIISG